MKCIYYLLSISIIFLIVLFWCCSSSIDNNIDEKNYAISSTSIIITTFSTTTVYSTSTSYSFSSISSFSTTTLNQPLKILFLGNSLTYVNDLPYLFSQLALSAGKDVTVSSSTGGGMTLEDHSSNSTSMSLIQSNSWDFVILQEQSLIPSVEQFRQTYMYPAARYLNSQIELSTSNTMFFLTWGYRDAYNNTVDGIPIAFTNYFQMQDELYTGYKTIADELDAKISPAGISWKNAKIEKTSIDLWSSDGLHPGLNGSYLAACSFYVAIFKESVVGNSFNAGLSSTETTFFQNIASTTVLNDLVQWNLN